MTVKPSFVPVLDTSGANRVPWGAGKDGVGYALNDPVPFGEYNYGLGSIGDWLTWLDERIHDNPASTTTNISDSVGGAGTGLFVGAAAIHLQHNTVFGDTATVTPQAQIHLHLEPLG